MAEKKRNPRFVTAPGELIYPWLVKPDTKYNSAGEYKAGIKLPEDTEMFDAKTGESQGRLSDYLNGAIEDSVAMFGEENNGKKKKGKVIEVTEAEDAPFYVDEGSLFVKFKLKAYVEPNSGDPFTQSPMLFDAKKKPFKPKSVWNGSVARIAFEVIPYYNPKDTAAGVTLRLKAAQIIELSTGSGASGDDYGFGEEDGFDAGSDDYEEDDGRPVRSDDEGYDDEEGEYEDDEEGHDF
jgi:hypothetical protein